MASGSASGVPIIALPHEVLTRPGSAAWTAARAQIWKSLEDYGCFEILHDRITPEMKDAVLSAAKELVSLPVETKRRNFSPVYYLGYIGQVPGLGYESLAIDNVLNSKAASDFIGLMWPEGNSSFHEAVRSFAEAAAAVEAAVRRMILECLGAEKYFEAQMGSTNYMMRLSEYTPKLVGMKAEPSLSRMVPPHTDASLTTLSIQSDLNGLELKTRSGDWISVKPSTPTSLVFILGDALRAWSNGKLRAPEHRVNVVSGKTRLAVLLFALPSYDAVIEAPPELVDEEKNPSRFKPYLFSEYLNSYMPLLFAAGDDPASILSTFCGTGAAGPKAEA